MVLFSAVVEAPFSPLLLLASASGLRRVVFLRDQPAEAWLQENVTAQVLWGLPQSLVDLEARVEAYLRGDRVDFKTIPLDLESATPFQHRVWQALKEIPYGTVVTYRELAWKIGRPQAARAVGNAVGANPVPIVIPCHRVVAAHGLGGFGRAGVAIKRALLKLEGVDL